MSKKPKRRTARGKSAPVKLSPEALERKAREDLAAGRHREAIAGFKQLLKLEPRPAWRLALADAYSGRARELAAKGMLKEAQAIWENRAALGEDVPFDPEQLRLLLRIGRLDSVLSLYTRAGAVSPADRDRMRCLLAAAYLTAENAVAEQLPADDPVLVHGAPARMALAAYCSGDDTALRNALAAIPFRSPYRDLVQILKALQQLPDRPEQAADLLSRVGDESAFAHARGAAQLALLPDAAFLEVVRGAGSASARFACLLRGWPQTRIALLEELARLGREPKSENMLRFLHRHREILGEDWVRRQSLHVLVGGYPASRGWLGAAGARSLSAEESLLLACWSAERRGDPWDEQESWGRYARHLIERGAGEGADKHNKLRIALALRRCDRLHDILPRTTHADYADDLDSLVAEQLEESLSWDADDRDTYLRLIDYYRRADCRKDARRLLEQAQRRWPEDMQVLGAALDSALDTGAFKKAAGLARQMLALDSINSDVRERLVAAHLAHARKQVAKGRPDLARKELSQATEWARSYHAREQIDLTSGLIALIEDAESGAAPLRDMLDRLGGGLGGQLALALAADALNISLAKLFDKLRLGKPAVAGLEDLRATLTKLRTHLDGGGKTSGELGALLTKALTKAPWPQLSRAETESALDTLRRCGLPKARLSLAQVAVKRWKGTPLFELHAFEAKYPSGYRRCSDKDIRRLEIALDRARAEGDTRIAMRIEEVLDEVDPFDLGLPPFSPPPPTGNASSVPDAKSVSLLIETLGLDKALDLFGLPPNMKRDFKKLERELGKGTVAETLISFLEMFSGLVDDENAFPPFPPTPERGPGKPKAKGANRRSAGDDAQDDDFFDQLDLF